MQNLESLRPHVQNAAAWPWIIITGRKPSVFEWSSTAGLSATAKNNRVHENVANNFALKFNRPAKAYLPRRRLLLPKPHPFFLLLRRRFLLPPTPSQVRPKPSACAVPPLMKEHGCDHGEHVRNESKHAAYSCCRRHTKHRGCLADQSLHVRAEPNGQLPRLAFHLCNHNVPISRICRRYDISPRFVRKCRSSRRQSSSLFFPNHGIAAFLSLAHKMITVFK